MTRYCSKHARTVEDDEACPGCADEVAAEHPEMAPVINRSRRWRNIYAAYVTVVTVLVFAGYGVFMLVREWVIWNR